MTDETPDIVEAFDVDEVERRCNLSIMNTHVGAHLKACISHIRWQAAEIERLREELDERPLYWECPDCCFKYSSEHVRQDGKYSCPVCDEGANRETIAALRQRVADYKAAAEEEAAAADEARQRVAELEAFIEKVDAAWSFDNYQQHTHSWHTKEDLFRPVPAREAKG
jgi:uncharacterized Zn finger protein (UPF0148 family)